MGQYERYWIYAKANVAWCREDGKHSVEHVFYAAQNIKPWQVTQNVEDVSLHLFVIQKWEGLVMVGRTQQTTTRGGRLAIGAAAGRICFGE